MPLKSRLHYNFSKGSSGAASLLLLAVDIPQLQWLLCLYMCDLLGDGLAQQCSKLLNPLQSAALADALFSDQVPRQRRMSASKSSLALLVALHIAVVLFMPFVYGFWWVLLRS